MCRRPLFWRAASLDDVRRQSAEYVYPLLVKPLFSHRFKKVFPGKYVRVTGFDELLAAFERIAGAGVEVLLLEEIPGADDRLCSCYTYIDEEGAPLFGFTKRILRRHPERQGFGCYHITDWSPEVLETGLRLVKHVGHRGIANVEFKRDDRDGLLKVIECNIRFTAANEILVASGYDLPLFVYSRLTGRPFPDLRTVEYKRGVRLWFPLADFLEFLALRRQGRITTGGWLRSVLHAPGGAVLRLGRPRALARHHRADHPASGRVGGASRPATGTRRRAATMRAGIPAHGVLPAARGDALA